MSFENGYVATDYEDMKNCINRYRKDSMIFYKALQVINTFRNNNLWPHNYNELENVLRIILGGEALDGILRFTSQYLYSEGNPEMRKVVWPHDLPDNFLEDLKAFYYSTYNILDSAERGRVNPLRYYGVARSTLNNQAPFAEKEIVRFLRMDGTILEMEMSHDDIKRLVRSFGIMLQNG